MLNVFGNLLCTKIRPYSVALYILLVMKVRYLTTDIDVSIIEYLFYHECEHLSTFLDDPMISI